MAPDLLGHGDTDAPLDPNRYDMEQVTADLAELIAACGVSRAHVLGYSMGGRVALAFAVCYPDAVKSLVLESASPGLETEAERRDRRESDERLASSIEHDGVPSFAEKWADLPLFASQRRLPDSIRQRQQSIRLRGTAQGYANSLRGLGTGRQPSYWPCLPSVRMPTLLVTGSLDEKFCAINRRMRLHLPASKHVVIDDAGHTPHMEQPKAFESHVFAFLHDCQGRNSVQ